MKIEEIQAILEKAIASAVKPTAAETPAGKVEEAISGIAKAVQAISAKVDSLEKTTVKTEPETIDTVVSKLAKTVEDIAKKVEEIKNPVKDEDKPVDLAKMTKKQFAEMIAGIVKPSEQKPKGKGKETQKSILDGANDEDEIDVDVSAIEAEDVAGNTLSDAQRLARKQLDDFLGAKLGNLSKNFTSEEEGGEDTEETTEE